MTCKRLLSEEVRSSSTSGEDSLPETSNEEEGDVHGRIAYVPPTVTRGVCTLQKESKSPGKMTGEKRKRVRERRPRL